MWRLGIKMESCGADLDSLLKCITCGFCMSAARFDKMDLNRLSAEVNVYRIIRVVDSSNVAVELIWGDVTGCRLRGKVEAAPIFCFVEVSAVLSGILFGGARRQWVFQYERCE